MKLPDALYKGCYLLTGDSERRVGSRAVIGRVGSPKRLDVEALLLVFLFDRLDIDYRFQIHDSHWLSQSFRCCGLAGAIQGILRRKQHPAAVQLPRVIRICLANASPTSGAGCYLSCSGVARVRGGRKCPSSKCDSCAVHSGNLSGPVCGPCWSPVARVASAPTHPRF